MFAICWSVFMHSSTEPISDFTGTAGCVSLALGAPREGAAEPDDKACYGAGFEEV